MKINMNEITKTDDIIMISLDTLRWDVAQEEYLAGNLDNLCRYSPWEKRHSPANFTYPAHQSIFAGFFPSPVEYTPLLEREFRFLPKNMGVNYKDKNNIFLYEEENLIKGLEKEGYHTICIGGVIFFTKRNALCSVLPNMFQESYWNPRYGVTNMDSAKYQIDKAINLLENIPVEERVFMFINISAIHGPNYFYKYENKGDYNPRTNVLASSLDSVETQKYALRYVDKEIGRLFDYIENRKKSFCIMFSDHGTCYGEDGYQGHNLYHEIVATVPYSEFFIEKNQE